MRQKADVEGLVDMYASNPDLKAFEGYTPETIGKVAPVLAKSLMNRANKENAITTDSINKFLHSKLCMSSTLKGNSHWLFIHSRSNLVCK